MTNEVDTCTHYELLIDEGDDPVHDNARLKQYMNNWDGPLFFRHLGVNKDQSILEVGVGTGRIAEQVLAIGCKEFTGIDISPKTIKRAQENLSGFKHIELLEENILAFVRPQEFDLIYSVLTFLHIEDKELALQNIYTSLKTGGHFVLSVDKRAGQWLDYGSRQIRLFPQSKKYYLRVLSELGFRIEVAQDTESGFASIIKAVKA